MSQSQVTFNSRVVLSQSQKFYQISTAYDKKKKLVFQWSVCVATKVYTIRLLYYNNLDVEWYALVILDGYIIARVIYAPVNKMTIASSIGLPPTRPKSSPWNNTDLLWIRTIRINAKEIWYKTQNVFSRRCIGNYPRKITLLWRQNGRDDV